jgi:hypothetical protein
MAERSPRLATGSPLCYIEQVDNPGTPDQSPHATLPHDFSLRTAFLVFLFLLSGCALQGTPRHSLGELRDALLNHDADGALKYVDVESITDHMAEDAFRMKRSVMKTDLDDLGLALGRSVVSAMLPQAKALIRKGVYAAIESDDQLGYFSRIKSASVWYFTIEENGDTAVVTPRGDDKVRFKMKRTDKGYWRITELLLKNR